MSMKNSVLTFAAWLTLSCIFAAIGIFNLDWIKYRRLAKFGVETQGQVTAKEPKNHKFVQYSYVVNQQIHFGFGNAGRGNAEFEKLVIGDTVKVSYDPDNPNTSFLGDPSEQFASMTRGLVFLVVLGPIFALIGLYAKGWFPFLARRS